MFPEAVERVTKELTASLASSTAPYPQELNPWSSQKSEPIHSSPAGKNSSGSS